MSDRHPKWVPVEPGHVIPAGQPYKIVWPEGDYWVYPGVVRVDECIVPQTDEATYFIDSSWRPPLDLPTEPTWGIVIICDGATWRQRVGQWALIAHGKRLRECRYFSEWRPEWVMDFIPLTDEQVARIESAR